MAAYFVPNLGPSVPMNAATEAWAERTGHKVERKEFADLETAKAFAQSIRSRVEDEKAALIWDSFRPKPASPPIRA